MRSQPTRHRATILALVATLAATLAACQSTEERPEVLARSSPPGSSDELATMPIPQARALAAGLAPAAERAPARTVTAVRLRLAERARESRRCAAPAGDPLRSKDARRRVAALAEVGRFGEAQRALEPLTGLDGRKALLAGAERIEALALAARLYALVGDAEGAARALGLAREVATGGRGVPDSVSRDPGAALALVEASAAQAAGRLDEAEARYRQALAGSRGPDDAATRIDPVDTASLLAANLLLQGRAVEAEAVARDGLGLALDAPGAVSWAGPGQPATLLAAAVRAQGRDLEAEALARAAIVSFDRGCAAPASLVRAEASRLLVRILGARGDWPGVGTELRRAGRALAADPQAFGRLHGSDSEPWLAAAHVGQAEDALRGLETLGAEVRAAHGPAAHASLELRGALGLARVEAGDGEAGLAELRASAAPYLEGRSALGRPESGARSGRMRAVLDGYVARLDALAASATDEDERAKLADEHFRVAQVLALGAIQRHFGPNASVAAARGAEAEALARELEATERAIAALAETLDRSAVLAPRWLPAELVEARRERMDALIEAREEIAARIARAFPRHEALLAPRPLGTGEVQRLMRPGEAMVVFQVAANQSWAWAIPQSGPIEYARLGVDADTLAAWVATLREALAPAGPVSPPESLPAFDVASAHALFEALLSPVAAGWRTANHLLFVADGPIGALPVAVLPTAEPRLRRSDGDLPYVEYRAVEWLGHQHAISRLPAVASLATIGRASDAATGGGPYAGFGDPVFAPPSDEDEAPEEKPDADAADPRAEASPADTPPAPVLELRALAARSQAERIVLADLPPLPDTDREVRAFARALGATSESLFLGQRASERNLVKRDLSRRQVIHLASHLLHPGALDGLDVPAIALSDPRVSTGAGDGLVSVDEVLALELDADVVVLTAASSDGPGRDAVRSTAALERAFMHAGARAVMSSSWPVNPAANTALLGSLPAIDVDELGRSRAEVLRLAMVAMVARDVARDADGSALYARAHPLFWAPYTLVGDGRTSLR